MHPNQAVILFLMLFFSGYGLKSQYAVQRLLKKETSMAVDTVQLLEKIDHDEQTLRVFMQGAFQGMQQKKDAHQVKPSDLFAWFCNETTAGNLANAQMYMPLSFYFSILFVRYYPQCDSDFQSYKKEHSHEASWQWFDTYCAKHMLIPALSEYKKMIIEEDAQEKT